MDDVVRHTYQYFLNLRALASGGAAGDGESARPSGHERARSIRSILPLEWVQGWFGAANIVLVQGIGRDSTEGEDSEAAEWVEGYDFGEFEAVGVEDVFDGDAVEAKIVVGSGPSTVPMIRYSVSG